MLRGMLALVLGLAVVAATTGCRSRARPEPIKVGLRPFVRMGPVSGHWQTPAGGKFGTTYTRRPFGAMNSPSGSCSPDAKRDHLAFL